MTGDLPTTVLLLTSGISNMPEKQCRTGPTAGMLTLHTVTFWARVYLQIKCWSLGRGGNFMQPFDMVITSANSRYVPCTAYNKKAVHRAFMQNMHEGIACVQ